MFVAFDIEDCSTFYTKRCFEIGKAYFDGVAGEVENNLDAYVTRIGSIDATSLMRDWFPEISADVFISHSHADEKKAIALAGWLFDNFKLRSFIDSCVWGYCNKLLKDIDKDYCDNGKPNSFSYEARNYSTAHVHVMLMNALTKMIDKCETVFFLNSENASYSLDDIETYTFSPWIFNEIEVTRTIRMRKPQRPSLKCFSADNLNESLKVSYRLTLDHLVPLSYLSLSNWVKKSVCGVTALDALYEMNSDQIKQLIVNRL